MTSNKRHMRQLTLVVGLAIVIEGALYSAIAPILPFLAREFTLGDRVVGLLVAGYSAGVIVGAIGCLALLKVWSTRTVAFGGLLFFALSTALFATTGETTVLISSRLGQGLAAGLVWTACTVWLVSAAPYTRRGEVIGRALSFTVVGTVGGPVIGTVATQVGIRWTYLAVVAVCVAVSGAVLLVHRDPSSLKAAPSGTSEVSWAAGPSRSAAALGTGLVVLAGLLAGTVQTAAPLHLTAVGRSDLFVGGVFITSALLTVAAGSTLGRVTDRRGAYRPVIAGLVCSAVAGTIIAIVPTAILYASSVVMVQLALFACYVPAGAMMSRAMESMGLPIQHGIIASAVAWGLGETLGAALSGQGLDAWGEGFTWAAVVTVVLVALVWASRTTLPREEHLGHQRPG